MSYTTDNAVSMVAGTESRDSGLRGLYVYLETRSLDTRTPANVKKSQGP
jgi:hypothetical protein